jgi:hypothetical protein
MTNFLHSSLEATAGDVVEVTLAGNAAYVMLMTPASFIQYRAGEPFTYFGGYAVRSPIRLIVPSAGTWYLVIDLGGTSGTVSASFKVFPAPAKLGALG